MKEQVEKLIKQIGTLQYIDTDKHKYFSKKATDILDSVAQGEYKEFIKLQSELIDCLEDKVRDNSVKNQLITIQKKSLIDKIAELFKEKKKESEIEKISEQIYIADKETQDGFIPDKRTAVYNFFKDGLAHIDRGRSGWGALNTISYINDEGRKREFSIGMDEYGGGVIKIGNSEFKTFVDSDGDYMFPEIRRNAIHEYLRLIAYANFINSKTEDKTFINEFGKEVERASLEYIPDNLESSFKVGYNIDKALRKNIVYKQTKKSFERAYKEYKDTYMKFMSDERKRKEDYDKAKSFEENLKVKEKDVDDNKTNINIKDEKIEEREELE